MQIAEATQIPEQLGTNPATVSLSDLALVIFFTVFAVVIGFIVIKIIFDLRQYRYH